ncbi:MAG: hypothetical protein N2490_01185 [Ignavibacteria bacterium]|nr:hypothetical protein [Ignavibacteria bacterium]
MATITKGKKINFFSSLKNLDVKNLYQYLILITLVIGLLAQIYSYINELIFCPNFGDPASRLDSSRRFYDSITPGIWNQIGTVWLPAHMILLLPFTKISFLWQTGIAGSIVGFISYVIGSILIFKIIYRITKDKFSAFIGWAIYALNPNILYLQCTAMSETVFFMFLIITFYYLQMLVDEGERMDVVKASFFMMGAVATRYEGWVVMIFTSILIFYVYYKKKHKPLLYALTFSSTSIAFIGFWLYHNWSRYGDALEFQRGKYSLLHHANAFLAANLLPTKGNLWLSTDFYTKAVILNTGWLIILIFIIGLTLYIYNNRLDLRTVFPYALLILYPFSIYSLYEGQNVIMLPNTEPSGFVHSRYGLSLLPAIAIFGGCAYKYLKDTEFIRKFKTGKKSLVYLFLILIFFQTAYWLSNFPNNIASLAELDYGSKQMYFKIKGVSEYLRENYDGGNILLDEVIIRLLPSCGVPYRERIFPNTWQLGEKALKEPSKYVKWIIIDTEATKEKRNALHYDEVYDKIKNNSDFLNNYKMVYVKEGVEVFKRM